MNKLLPKKTISIHNKHQVFWFIKLQTKTQVLLILKILKTWSWKDDSAVKTTDCSENLDSIPSNQQKKFFKCLSHACIRCNHSFKIHQWSIFLVTAIAFLHANFPWLLMWASITPSILTASYTQGCHSWWIHFLSDWVLVWPPVTSSTTTEHPPKAHTVLSNTTF